MNNLEPEQKILFKALTAGREPYYQRGTIKTVTRFGENNNFVRYIVEPEGGDRRIKIRPQAIIKVVDNSPLS